MSRRQIIAVAVALAAMVIALVPPAWVHATGDEATLPIRPVDPLSLFRGNYVDLRYDIPVDPGRAAGVDDEAVYAVFADERPGRLLRLSEDRPSLDEGEFCVRGRYRGGEMSFPHLEQVYVTPERGREIEDDLSAMVVVIKVTGSCRAVVVDVEPRVDTDR